MLGGVLVLVVAAAAALRAAVTRAEDARHVVSPAGLYLLTHVESFVPPPEGETGAGGAVAMSRMEYLSSVRGGWSPQLVDPVESVLSLQVSRDRRTFTFRGRPLPEGPPSGPVRVGRSLPSNQGVRFALEANSDSVWELELRGPHALLTLVEPDGSRVVLAYEWGIGVEDIELLPGPEGYE